MRFVSIGDVMLGIVIDFKREKESGAEPSGQALSTFGRVAWG